MGKVEPMTPWLLFQLAIILFIIQWVLSKFKPQREGLDNVLAVENAFTDTRCINDNLPLLRFYPHDNPNTFRCLSVDGQTCINRQSLAIPSDYTCNDARKNVNFYLTTDGLRNVNVNKSLPISKVFNDFENIRLLPANNPLLNKNIKYLTCTPDGLKNPNHWCGQVWNTIKSECDTPRGKFGEFKPICDNLPSYIAGAQVGTNVIETNYETIAANQKTAMEQMQNARQANLKGRAK